MARTVVAGMSDHVALHVAHPLMPRDPTVIRHAVGFLLHGHFDPGGTGALGAIGQAVR